jgi:hypothetical protein
MNRRSFVGLLTGIFFGSRLLKAKPVKAQLSKFARLNPPFNSEGILICGVPVYADPYCETDFVYCIRRKQPRFSEFNGSFEWCDADNSYVWSMPLLPESETFDRSTAVQYIVGAIKKHGDTPDFCLVDARRWRELLQSMKQTGTFCWFAPDQRHHADLPNFSLLCRHCGKDLGDDIVNLRMEEAGEAMREMLANKILGK